MMDSLIVTENAQQEFDNFKRLRTRAAFYKLEAVGKKFEVQLDASVAMDSTRHEDIFSHFPADECRYVFFNIEYSEGMGRRDKTCFVLWVPEGVSVKQKMIYAGWALMFKKHFSIHSIPIQTSHVIDLEYDLIVENCRARFD